jgi:predicted DNA-binding transcriptional regulator AlpA
MSFHLQAADPAVISAPVIAGRASSAPGRRAGLQEGLRIRRRLLPPGIGPGTNQPRTDRPHRLPPAFAEPRSLPTATRTGRRGWWSVTGMGSNIGNLAGLPFWPLMLSDDQAALYTGLSLARFHRAVAAGDIPKPRSIQGAIRWCRTEIDRHLDGSTPAEISDEDRLADKLEQWVRP